MNVEKKITVIKSLALLAIDNVMVARPDLVNVDKSAENMKAKNALMSSLIMDKIRTKVEGAL